MSPVLFADWFWITLGLGADRVRAGVLVRSLPHLFPGMNLVAHIGVVRFILARMRGQQPARAQKFRYGTRKDEHLIQGESVLDQKSFRSRCRMNLRQIKRGTDFGPVVDLL